MTPKGIRRIGDIGSIMAQYKSVKITSEDYDALKRYMHLGFLDSMSEAFHSALRTAMFEEYGHDEAAKLSALAVEKVEKVEHKGVKKDVSHAKRDNIKQKKISK